MPRSYPAGLLDRPNLCTAVLIERADSVKYGLSDSRVDFVYGGVTYKAFQGADVSQIAAASGTSVDNLDVETILDDALSYVRGTDVAGRKYEDSRWTMFQIDYTDPTFGIMVLSSYRMAKATISDVKMKLELLGLLSFLKQTTGRTYGKMCDVLKFGDVRCDPFQTIRAARSASRTVGATINRMTVDFFGDSRGAHFYSFGDATWTSGDNVGVVDQIKTHVVLTPTAYAGGTTYGMGVYVTSGGATYYSRQAGNVGHTPASSPTWWQVVTGNPASVARIVWKSDPGFPVAVGDIATLCFGCDRRKVTCKTVPNAGNASTTNVENFQGFAGLPSPDKMMEVGKGG